MKTRSTTYCRSASCPTNIDNAIANAKDDRERARLAKIMERGLKVPSGYVLPLEWDAIAGVWNTCKWQTRRDRLTLIPGDSPMGLRLPLNDLPVSAEAEIPPERDPFEPREPLPTRSEMEFPASGFVDINPPSSEQQVQAQPSAQPRAEAELGASIERPIIRTTLCIEPRDGRLYIFMPPVYSLDNYVELIAAIEETAQQLGAPVVIEGYEPPRDPRMQKLLVTPDPGVIEVNIHPSTNWRELVGNMTELYAAAKESRLGHREIYARWPPYGYRRW